MNKEQQKETMSDTELKLRTLLAFSYCGPMLYHDDGELQDNTAHPFIDFKNDNVNTIADKMLRRTEDVFSNTRTNAKEVLIKKIKYNNSITDVRRLEDMSAVGRLHLMLDDDGDVIVSVHSQTDDELISCGENIEFCTTGMGGGGSPRTYDALRNLMQAMHDDNLDSHWQGRAIKELDL